MGDYGEDSTRLEILSYSKSIDWSFIAAILIITLAAISLLTTILYYCWIHQVVTTLTSWLAELVHHKQNTVHKQQLFNVNSSVDIEKQLVSAAAVSPLPELPTHTTDHYRPTADPYRPTADHYRPTTEHQKRRRSRRDTRQRYVNKQLHALKNDKYKRSRKCQYYSSNKSPGPHYRSERDGPTPPTPRTPAKGESSTSSSSPLSDKSEYGSATSTTTCSRGTGKVAVDSATAPNGHVQQTASSYRSHKWSKIRPKITAGTPTHQETYNASLPHQDTDKTSSPAPPEPAIYKIGRCARAVAPQNTRTGSGTTTTSTKHRMYPYVQKIISANLLTEQAGNMRKGNKFKELSSHLLDKPRSGAHERSGAQESGADKLETLYDVLLTIRQSGDIGLNYLHDPVSKVLCTREHLPSSPPSPHNDKLTNIPPDHPSLSSPPLPQTNTREEEEHSSLSDEIKSSSSGASIATLSDQIPPDVEKSEVSKLQLAVSDQLTAAVTPVIDTSLPVFGVNPDTGTVPDTGPGDTKETKVRPIDGLFCSSTPSSDTNISENIYLSQHVHNHQNTHHHSISPDPDIINNLDQIPDVDKVSQFFPNLEESSLASTSLPSLSSSISITTTLLSSTEDNNISGQLKFFEELQL